MNLRFLYQGICSLNSNAQLGRTICWHINIPYIVISILSGCVCLAKYRTQTQHS